MADITVLSIFNDYVLPVIGTFIGIGLTALVATIKQKYNIDIQAGMEAVLKRAIDTGLDQAIADGATPKEAIAAAIAHAAQSTPDAVKGLGATEQVLLNIASAALARKAK